MLRSLKTLSTAAAFATITFASTVIGTDNAKAEAIHWATNGSCATGYTCNASEMNFLSSDGSVLVTAQAWSYNGSEIEAADLGKWSGGLGVINNYESGGSPSHTVDNSGSNDFIAFTFSQAVEINAVRVNSYGDTDMTVWIGQTAGVPSFAGLDFDDLDVNYGTHFDNYGGDANRTANFGSDAETGNLLVVAALVPANGWKDYFKIKKLYAETIEIVPDEETEVSAPATLLVFGPALFGFGLVRRRNARKAALRAAAATADDTSAMARIAANG